VDQLPTMTQRRLQQWEWRWGRPQPSPLWAAGLFTCRPPDAAGVRLRQVYAELGGMIGGSHKSESCMLVPKILETVRATAPSQAA